MNARRSAVLTALIGLVVVVVIASMLGKPAADTIQLILIAGGAAVATGILGAVGLHVLRGRSLLAQVVLVALTSTVSVAAGSLAASNAMFLESRDLATLAVVISVGAVVAIVSAMLLGARIGAASRSVGEAARRLVWERPPGAPLDDDDAPVVKVRVREFARLAEQLEQTRLELDESRERERAIDRARRELVSWVSHDLRTPLAGIRAITELLEDDMVDDPEEVREYYGKLRRESDKLAALVQDLFEVSRIEAGALKLEYSRINLDDLVSDALATAIPIAEQRGIRVYGQVPDPLAVVEASLPELSRVVSNLVANAVRETPDGGAVLVHAKVDEAASECVLTVQDSCGGIPDDVIARVFEASFRGESARTPRNDGGAGLGLAIARGFVEAHGGRIGVENVSGGCCFTARLPIAPQALQAEAPAPQGSAAPVGQTQP